ncbi:hypothetical protein MNBD_GAMMA18-2289 [hydrothermal vent metagenome]|uniref:Uncharacterized protein n=1 Tax=hydrothermal vent metagenome TaxID=652676 RepID=A0A3B0ZRJ6_9ZZZZ
MLDTDISFYFSSLNTLIIFTSVLFAFIQYYERSYQDRSSAKSLLISSMELPKNCEDIDSVKSEWESFSNDPFKIDSGTFWSIKNAMRLLPTLLFFQMMTVFSLWICKLFNFSAKGDFWFTLWFTVLSAALIFVFFACLNAISNLKNRYNSWGKSADELILKIKFAALIP